MPEFLQLMENWAGYHSVAQSQINESAVAQLVDLIANKPRLASHRWEYEMREVITTSDFPTLFGVAIDRQMIAAYAAVMADWRSYVKTGTVPNFNRFERHKVYGNDYLLPEVPEKGEYLVGDVGTGYYYGQLKKYGRQFDISWEAIINDSMGAFADLATRFATAAIRSEARYVTDLFASAAGPDVGLFGAPITDVDGQNVTNLGVLPLTIANLERTLELMAAQTDPNGEPIAVRGVHLVVPPALEFTARQILTSAIKQWVELGGAGGPLPYPTTNVVAQYGIQLHVDPYLPVVDTSGNRNATWYVFADPSQGVALEMNFLRGYEQPEVCMKASDKVTLGGGAISPFTGDFASDNIFYRVRHVFGGARRDPRFAYAQVHA